MPAQQTLKQIDKPETPSLAPQQVCTAATVPLYVFSQVEQEDVDRERPDLPS